MFGIAGICKAYRALLSSKCHSEDELSPKKPQPKPKPKVEEEPFKSIDETCKALNDKHNDGRAMNGLHGSDYNGEGTRGDEPTSPRGMFKNSSIHNHFPSTPSPLSRSSSTNTVSRNPSLSKSASRSRTPTPMTAACRLLKSVSRNNADTHASPVGGCLSKSLSSRKGPTTSFTEGGSLSRSTSSRKSPTTSFPEGGSLSRSTSNRKGHTPIMYSNSNGLIKPPATEKNIECTLEELCFGCVKRITITREVVTINGQIVEEEENLTIKVKPGWRKGTKITFEGMGNETPGTYPADIIFVIGEKRHSLYRREGDDLELAVQIPLVKALTGCTLSIPLLGGEKMSLTIDDIIQTGYEKIIAGQGMPKSKEEGNRGNLIIKFLVQFPTKLTKEQQAEVFSILQGC